MLNGMTIRDQRLDARPPNQDLAGRAAAQLQRLLATLGWEVSYIDLDLTSDRPTAEVRLMRVDGRWIWGRIDALGRCAMERFHRERSLQMTPGQRGTRPLSPQCADVFLGRQYLTSPKSLLSAMVRYVAANAQQPISSAELRAAWIRLWRERVEQRLGQVPRTKVAERAGGGNSTSGRLSAKIGA
ncbi:MAG: hypothetical protein IPO08_18990 [Xanthomonadales bacterium]|nr:hypothetical protein [Xanthomonadales bacterium]